VFSWLKLVTGNENKNGAIVLLRFKVEEISSAFYPTYRGISSGTFFIDDYDS